MNSKLTCEDVGYRKEHCITDPFVAEEIGRQTRHGLTKDTPRGEDFFPKVIGSFLHPSM
jgi:hypothetical protein